MTGLLIKLFVKNPDNIQDIRVRSAYGSLAGITGIVCNIFLFLFKLIAGTISGSVSITADAINNLSDASSNIISLIGFKMGSKPADSEHPYGHARYEYLSGLTVAVLILVIGIELLKSSIVKLFNPAPVEFSMLVAIILFVSILVKLWMMLFNKKIGCIINSKTLIATATDSRNDVISTSAVLVAALFSHYFRFELDAFMGIAVAAFILYSGISLIKETLSPLLGKAPSPEFVSYIQKKIMSYDGVLGTHDLMVHDYGPGRQFASVHVEMAAESNVLQSHDIIDNIERDFLMNDNLHIIIHYDPIVTSDDAIGSLRKYISSEITSIHPGLTIHDLRIVPGVSHTNVIFDCLIPYDCKIEQHLIYEKITQIVRKKFPDYFCVITFDTSFAPIPH